MNEEHNNDSMNLANIKKVDKKSSNENIVELNKLDEGSENTIFKLLKLPDSM